MRIEVKHSITVRFEPPANHVLMHLLVQPKPMPHQRIVDWLVTTSEETPAAGFTDAYGNHAQLVTQPGPVAEVTVHVRGMVETARDDGVVGRLTDDPVPELFLRATPSTRSPVSMHGKFRNVPIDGPERLDVLHQLMERVHTTLNAAREQDAEIPTPVQYAESYVAAARALGVPARYITGYVAEAGDFVEPGPHVWAEAWDKGLGWVGFDPLSNMCPTGSYVRVAAGLDAATTLAVRVHPQPVMETISHESVEIDIAAQRQQ